MRVRPPRYPGSHAAAIAFAALLLLPVGQAVAQNLAAFPGAEGFGATTPGGRGGDVHLVTTLADYGDDENKIEGSLRAAVEAEGARTVVFRVAGTIDLKEPLEVTHPFLTVAGQTAPGDGVLLKNHGLLIWAPHVVVRYLRIRPGDTAVEEQDAVDIRASHVVIDHCSVSWGTDEVLSVTGGATNVTVQWSLIAESLDESVHRKGAHGYGTLIDDADSVSIHHNIYALHRSRNPRPKDALLDFRNNLIYGWGDRPGYNEDDATRMNYVGNYLYPLEFSDNENYGFILGGTRSRVFVSGNVLHGDAERSARQRRLIRVPGDEGAAEVFVDRPFETPPISTANADDLLGLLLDEAGAVRPGRDAVDQRVIDLIRSGEGTIIDSQDDVGGWPALAPGEPTVDADRDGMPDEWEREHGLDFSDSNDHRLDLDGDGYTNLEEYLNGTDPTRPERTCACEVDASERK